MKWRELGRYLRDLVFRKDCRKAVFGYVRGVYNLGFSKFVNAIDDFKSIIEDESHFFYVNRWLVYKNLGIAYARNKNADEAEKFLKMALEHESSQEDGELFMWLGYVNFGKQDFLTALEYFKRAQRLNQKGLNKWLVDKDWVRENIARLRVIIDDETKQKYKDILPDF